ncbi:S26 family signal peptidase [Amnibacterium sp. CER49]|uniref:S26 family signal peptidase n=1 Tax=Amnibacterium sp. CER49 TaxID=3039161 RepID=UPI00244B0BC6|nr:S26 family signal peptidase [Amnibacterium sp. CER49]MDH2444004.1 S26 family signal peptidase [Amnibacterium sp. CER49]
MTATTLALAAVRHARAVPRSVVALRVLAVVVLALVAAGGTFRLLGGQWYVVETPSMGTTAPVGSLVFDVPVRAAVAVGDIVSFHPPTAPKELYTHRIVAIAPAGAITTRGDINGAPDGWQLRTSDIVGRVTVILPGIGWGLRALPIIVPGALLAWFIGGLLRSAAARRATRLLGGSLAVGLAAAWLHPFTGMVLLSTGVTDRIATATVVATGLLPIRVSGGGRSVDLTPGQVGRLHIPVDTASAGHFALQSALHLPVVGWAGVALACAAPLLLACAVLIRPPKADREAA